MFDTHIELNDFFKEHVRLKPDRVEELDTLRQRNLDRLNTGLDKLGFNGPVRTPVQGGRAMKTLNQTPENNQEADYDIDTATIFKRDDLPENPLDARRRVLAGVQKGGGNFSQEPEARTNAVTVWYQGGYHVDLAVHRIYTNDFGEEIIEHAGVEWSRRNPADITNWFKEQVEQRSPSKSNGATVDAKQMRRIVQLLKYFSKSRKSWKLPGGLIISALVSKYYVPDYFRDDKALYETMRAIYYGLLVSVEVANPVDSSQSLTYKDEYRNQVGQFRDKLCEAIDWLSPLFEASCDREQAARAWNTVYKHSYWENLAAVEAEKARGEALKAAAAAGSLYTGSQGILSTTKPAGRSVSTNQPHRFYGEG